MGVYTGSTYNPLGAIQAGINNVNERNRIKNEYWKRKGEIWSNFAKDMGKLGGRLVDAYSTNSEDPDSRLAALEDELEEAERVKAIEDQYNDQVAQRQAVADYIDRYNKEAQKEELMKQVFIDRQAAEMNGYKPVDYMNPYAQYLNGQGVYLSDIENEYRRRY